MTDVTRAEELNQQGMDCSDRGDKAAAEAAYRAAIDADPLWAAPVYNLGLLCKYQGRWEESFDLNEQAVEIDPENEAAWWNLGIAATALRRWSAARRAWHSCGLTVPEGEGPPDFNWGATPVRLDPDDHGEVVWAARIDPARARLVSIPLPTCRFQWGDLVLTDGAEEGQRTVNGRTYSVFKVLERIEASGFRKFIVELATADDDAIEALERLAKAEGGTVEYWGKTTRIMCRACSLGAPHEHPRNDGSPANPHLGVAARGRAQAEGIITAWLALTASADLIRWYEAPPIGSGG
jgi:tetratricopeptide (TPR) repeat protein